MRNLIPQTLNSESRIQTGVFRYLPAPDSGCWVLPNLTKIMKMHNFRENKRNVSKTTLINFIKLGSGPLPRLSNFIEFHIFAVIRDYSLCQTARRGLRRDALVGWPRTWFGTLIHFGGLQNWFRKGARIVFSEFRLAEKTNFQITKVQHLTFEDVDTISSLTFSPFNIEFGFSSDSTDITDNHGSSMVRLGRTPGGVAPIGTVLAVMGHRASWGLR